MPIKINEASGEQYLVVHVWGKLVKADYERFLPQFAELSQRPGKLRLLFDMIGFKGWAAGALYEELKFHLKHADDFERVATVGDNKWERVMAIMIKPFTKAETRYFDATQYAAAREWLSAGDRCEDRAT